MGVPITYPMVDKEMTDAVALALEKERMVLGDSVGKFEEAYAKYCGTDHAVSVSSGTNALSLAMEALGARGNDVMTVPMSFIASANAVIHAGAKPVFCDIDDNSYCMDPTKIEAAITEKTKGIVPVHLYGQPADMDAINEIAKKNGIWVLEDAAEAHGASYKCKRTGSLGIAGCFSFYTTKNMTVGGDGGMVTTNDEKLATAIAKFRDCGRKTHYEHDVVGYTSRLNSINAAFGLVQLKRLDGWNEHRRKAAALYEKKLADVPEVTPPPSGDGKDYIPSFYVYAIRCPDREELKDWLKAEKGIGSMPHFPIPIHLQPAYKDRYGYQPGQFPISEKHGELCLSIPMFSDIRDEQVGEVCDAISEFYAKRRK